MLRYKPYDRLYKKRQETAKAPPDHTRAPKNMACKKIEEDAPRT